jgi:hypothetical protein
MCEDTLSKELRCKEMLQIDTGLLIEQRYLLPKDWRTLDFVRVVGGSPLRYSPRDDFYNTDSVYVSDRIHCYTLAGDYIIVGVNTVDGTSVEIHYYQDIPPLGNDITWTLSKYPTLFTTRTLWVASAYSIEDDRGGMWKSTSDDLISAANAEHATSKASGSRLTRRHIGKIGGFG